MKSLNLVFLLVTALLLGNVTLSWSQTPEQLFQKGLQKEEGEGMLQEAIDIYETIVAADDVERELQARALLHIGLCYQKLGNKEAREAYQRIINEFGEQKELVTRARDLLSQMQTPKTDQESPKGIILKQVWNGPNVNDGGTISPDGRFISYWDNETGNLAYREISTGKTRLLTNEGTYDEPMQFTINSAISPNGKQIAYSWYNLDQTYDLRIVNVDDPQPYVLYGKNDEEVYPVSWSADGEYVLVRGYSDTLICQIMAVALSTGDTRVLKTFEEGFWMHMVFSPDNRLVVYDVPVESDGGSFDIGILAAGDEKETLLVEHPANDRLLGWIPNTNEVLFISDRTGTWDCWIISVVDGKPAGKAQRILPGIGRVHPMGFTMDGIFYYGILSRKQTTFIAPLDQKTATLESDLAKPLLGSIYDVEFSPDGESLAYVKEFIEPAGPGWYHRPLYVLNRKTGEERMLTKKLEVKSPHWSNNGSRIICTGFDRKKEEKMDYYGGLYEINVETGMVLEILLYPEMERELVYSWNGSVADWSADDLGIYYINGPRIKKRDLLTGEEVTLIEQEDLSPVLHLSPDGNELLYCVEPPSSGHRLIMRIPVSGGEPMEIGAAQASDRINDEAVWSADGNHIFFSEKMDNGSVIWRVTKEGGPLQIVWQSEDQISGISMHPDGGHVAVSSFMQEAEIWGMENIMSYKANGK
jgi:Tol biopolymer transport system component